MLSDRGLEILENTVGDGEPQPTLLSWAADRLREFPRRDQSRLFYEVFLAGFFLTQTPAGNIADVYRTSVTNTDSDSLIAASASKLESANGRSRGRVTPPVSVARLATVLLAHVSSCQHQKLVMAV